MQLSAARASPATISSRRFCAMATRVEMHFVHAQGEDVSPAFDVVAEEIERVEQALSAHRPGASLHTLNAALAHNSDAATTDPLLRSALALASELSELSDGLFDPTLGANTRFDLGAIGKGIALDHIRPLLVAWGVVDGLVSIGESSVLVLGHHPHGAYWPLSLPDPLDSDATLIEVGLHNLCWSVSSNIRVTDEGAALNPHIIDPRTGEAIAAPRTVLALSPEGARAEALSTAMLVAAPHERAGLAARFKKTPVAVFDHEDGDTKLYNGMEAWLI